MYKWFINFFSILSYNFFGGYLYAVLGSFSSQSLKLETFLTRKITVFGKRFKKNLRLKKETSALAGLA